MLSRTDTPDQPLELVLPADRPVNALVVHEAFRPVEIPSIAGERSVALEGGCPPRCEF